MIVRPYAYYIKIMCTALTKVTQPWYDNCCLVRRCTYFNVYVAVFSVEHEKEKFEMSKGPGFKTQVQDKGSNIYF